jgi:hypothetical protein
LFLSCLVTFIDFLAWSFLFRGDTMILSRTLWFHFDLEWYLKNFHILSLNLYKKKKLREKYNFYKWPSDFYVKSLYAYFCCFQDMDLIKFVITSFKIYYPSLLSKYRLLNTYKLFLCNYLCNDKKPHNNEKYKLMFLCHIYIFFCVFV